MKQDKTTKGKRTALMAVAVPVMFTMSACGKAIEPTKIMGIPWQCSLVVNGERSEVRQDILFHQVGQVNHITYVPGQPAILVQAVYKLDGSKFEYTDRIFGTRPIMDSDGPSFVGKFTRTEQSHLQFEGRTGGGGIEQEVKADCSPRQ
ncbi:hypothetical protein N5J06_03940 [Ralstonia sp. CHL-2022]|uniref:Lipoprotein n=1 Tax=Ralstonia mojiangensis TaxID=2953895 RepID=A0ABT2L482_9RALS|nr:hypothetical protein [Ralstonia mojiangensis]MCT7310081.1 hypothetical protein [Ralstonia mojiangensis]